MMMFTKLPRHLTGALACAALALTMTAAPIALSIPDMDGAAYAKNGNGNGGGNGGKGGKGKSDDAKLKKGSKSKGTSTTRRGGIDPVKTIRGLFKKPAKTKRSASKRQQSTTTTATVETEVVTALTPNQKGRWNAANANQNALDAHIRNQNFNGTIGALSYYQLAGKAASGAELTEDEQAALDSLLGDTGATIPDSELEDLLNSADPDAPVWSVSGGTATCTANCDGVDVNAANQDIADYVDEQDANAQDQAIDDLWADAQQRIIDESNKPTEGIEDQLLDELANDLGFDRMDTIDEDAEAVDPDEVTLLPEEVDTVDTATN